MRINIFFIILILLNEPSNAQNINFSELHKCVASIGIKKIDSLKDREGKYC